MKGSHGDRNTGSPIILVLKEQGIERSPDPGVREGACEERSAR